MRLLAIWLHYDPIFNSLLFCWVFFAIFISIVCHKCHTVFYSVNLSSPEMIFGLFFLLILISAINIPLIVTESHRPIAIDTCLFYVILFVFLVNMVDVQFIFFNLSIDFVEMGLFPYSTDFGIFFLTILINVILDLGCGRREGAFVGVVAIGGD